MILNQSRIQQYANCPRLFYWGFVENLAPDRPNMNFEIGSATHEALALLATSDDYPLEDAVAEAKKRLVRDLPKRRLPGDEEAIEVADRMVEKLVRGYVAHYGRHQQFKSIGNEVAGTVEIGENTGHFLRFRIDKIVNWRGSLWILDHKTTAKMDMREVSKYQMSFQMQAYVYAVTKYLGVRVNGVVVDMLVKTQIPQYHQEVYAYTDESLAEWEHDFVQYANEIQARKDAMKHYVDAGKDPKLVWRKNTGHCFNYGTCTFRNLCLRDTPGERMAFTKRTPDYVDDASLLAPPDRNADPA